MKLDDLSALTDEELLRLADLVSALSSPIGMARYCWGPAFELRAHTELISKACAGLMSGEYDRLILSMPPQVGKSWLAGVWLPFWWLANRPDSRNAVVSYAANLAVSRGRAVRKLVNEYGAPFTMRLAPDSRAVNDWHLTSGGGLRCVGVGGSLTGHPVDGVGIVDDPHKDRAEADSPAFRERVHDHYSSTLISRLAPGTPLVIVQTRWHEDDLAGRRVKEEGRLEEGGRWKVINLPAFADSKADPLGRAPGEPLPHPRITEGDTDALRRHWEEKRATTKPRDWGALFQGDPQPAEGALLSWEVIRSRTVVKVPPAVRTVVGIDPSGGGRDTAGIVAGHVDADGVLYWTHDRSGVMASDEWAKAACELVVEADADLVVYEANFGGDQPEKLFRLTWDALRRDWYDRNPHWQAEKRTNPFAGLRPRVEAVHARKGKMIRADPVAGLVRLGQAWFGPGLGNLSNEWATYQEGAPESPGALDASVVIAFKLVRSLPAGLVVSSPASAPKTPAVGMGFPSAGPGAARITRRGPGGFGAR